ncbi:MAG TPA: GNAT family N-acetyltransferase [Streptosporangiaceae bacterium]|nr:GNAT family N-acetyltransferase [Streptosporangiaceae bacterium]
MSVPAVSFRPLCADDLPALAGWLAQPHVATWWCEPSGLSSVTERYLPCLDGRDPTELFVIEVEGVAAGFIQRYLYADELDSLEALRATGTPGVDSAAGIDYLIGHPNLTGRGIGPVAISGFTRLAFARYPEASAVIVGVSQANTASWRALEKAGFTRCWAGELASDDPSDEGSQYLYRKDRSPAP